MQNRISKGFDILLCILQLCISSYLVYSVRQLIPSSYLMIVCAVLILLMILSFFLLIKKGSKTKNLIGKIISLIICIALIFGSATIFDGFKALNNITDGNYQTHVVSVIVKSDSSYNELKDLAGKTIGAINNDSTYVSQAKDEIKNTEQVEVNYEAIDTFDLLLEALNNDEVDAIILNEAYRGVMDELDIDFNDHTRTIYQYEVKEEIEPTSTGTNVAKDTFSVYISGIDTYGPVSTVARSDVNMIVTVNPQTKQILLTSIPRDYYVPLATSGMNDKLTHSGIYGINETVSTMENLLGINIDYYIRINFSSLIKVVDALGGVEVYSDRALTLSNFNIQEGMNHMNGEMALRYSRERYSYSEGDRHRVQNQQEVITGIINKMLTPALLSNYSQILDSVGDAMEMSLTTTDISRLIQMQLNDNASWQIMRYSLNGSGSMSTTCYSMPGYNLYVMIPYEETVSQASSYIQNMENGNKITVN